MTTFFRNTLFILIVLAAAFFIVKKTAVWPSIENIFSQKPVVIDNTPILIKQIKEIAQLMTIEMHDEVVVDSAKITKLNAIAMMYPLNTIPLITVPQVVLIVKGKVIAGMDLQQLNKNSVHVMNDSIHIELPKAKILDVIINPSDVTTFIEKGDWTPKEVTAVKRKAEQKMVKDAHDQNVLKRAELKAVSVVEDLMLSTGYKKVLVTVSNQ